MEDIMGHYGIGFLQMTGGIVVLTLFFHMLQQDGVLYQLVMQYMTGICG